MAALFQVQRPLLVVFLLVLVSSRYAKAQTGSPKAAPELEAQSDSSSQHGGSNQPLLVSQVRQLVKLAAEKREVEDRAPLNSLGLILQALDEGSACSGEVAGRVRHFHDLYVDTDRPSRGEQLSDKLRYFYVAMVYELSKLCQTQLAEELAKAELAADITEQDFETIEELETRYSNTLFPAHVDSYAEVHLVAKDPPKESRATLAVMAVPELDTARKARKLCHRKLAPVYRQLVTPLALLATTGYDYKAAPEHRKLTREDIFQRWYKVATHCELIMEASIYQMLQTTPGTVSLRFMNQDALKALKLQYKFMKPLDKSVEQRSEYQAPRVQLPDDRLQLSGSELDKLVRRTRVWAPVAAIGAAKQALKGYRQRFHNKFAFRAHSGRK